MTENPPKFQNKTENVSVFKSASCILGHLEGLVGLSNNSTF